METTYEDILKRARSECDSFSLIWQDEYKFNDNAKDIELKLQPYLLKEERVKEWPGLS